MSTRHASYRITAALFLGAALAAAVTACDRDPLAAPRTPTAPSAARSATSPPIGAGGILFVGTHDESKGEIYRMSADGSRLVRLTSDTLADFWPHASPDGTRFTWVHRPPNAVNLDDEVYVADIDGSHPRAVTRLHTSVYSPRFSPDGTRILFTALMPDGTMDLYVVNVDGTGLVNLTNTSASSEQFASWSPDGARIAFGSNRVTGHQSIWVMNADGSHVKLLRDCSTGFGCGQVAWSPLGTELVMVTSVDRDILTIDANTGATTGYIPTDSAEAPKQPDWSSDGRTIVFASQRGGNGTFDLWSAAPTRPGDLIPRPAKRLTSIDRGNEHEATFMR